MTTFTLKCQKINSNSLALTNLVYLAANDYNRLAQSGVKYLFLQNTYVYSFGQAPDVAQGFIALSGTQRSQLDVSLNQPLSICPYRPTDADILGSIKLNIKFVNEKRATDKPFKVETIEEVIKTNFADQFFDLNQDFICDVAGSMLQISVSGAECVEITQKQSSQKKTRGILLKSTQVICGKAPDSCIKLTGGNVQATSTSNMLFGPNFNFEQMGIGGLDKEFSDIFRRAFASRVFPTEVVKNLGIRHVKGILLHGPPGTGKTLIARKIGQMLNAREPKIVNGPEVLNKFVGQSEENIRALFADAEKEEKLKGAESELHIIIFDELDAICKERGSGVGGGTGVGDSIVNQLLAKMDGVDQLNNILIIGMTNRKDMLDEALIRPGRLEVHMEIGLPDEHGRVQIFNIHTTPMRDHNYIDSRVNIPELAHLTKNYSGAEIEGVVKSAASYALNRQLDVKKITNPDPTKIKVTQDDFLLALSEVKPAFGVTEDKLEKSIRNGIINFSTNFLDVQNSMRNALRQVESSLKTPLVSVILSGKPGSGKTALAASIAKESGFPFIKCLFPEDFVGQADYTKSSKISKAFQDAYKSEISLIVVDDIERFIEFAPIGSRFSNTVLQTLLVLFKTLPTKGRRLMIIGTTSRLDVLNELGFLDAVDHIFDIPTLNSGPEVCKVLHELMNWNRTDLGEIERKWRGSIEIKRLISLAEMSSQAYDPNNGMSQADVFLKLHQSGMMNRKQL